MCGAKSVAADIEKGATPSFSRSGHAPAYTRLLVLFVVDGFAASGFGCFGFGENPFAYRLDDVRVEGFRGLGDVADETGCGAGSSASEG